MFVAGYGGCPLARAVAQRTRRDRDDAGHSVEILLKLTPKCLDVTDIAIRNRMQAALGHI